MRDPRFGALFAAGSSFAYGFNTPFARLAHENGIDTAIAVLSRASLLLVAAALFALLTGASLAIPRERWFSILVLALATALISVAYLGSVAFISASLAAIIFFTFPIQILICTILRGDEPGDVRRIVIFLFAFVGLVLVIFPQSGGIDWRGAALAGVASAGATFMYFLAHRLTSDCSVGALIFWIHLVVVPIALIAALMVGRPLPSAAPGVWWPVAVLSVSYVAAFALQILALRCTSPVNAGLYFNLEPVMTGIVAAAFLGERLMPVQYGGAALVVVALAIATRTQAKSPLAVPIRK